MVGPDSFLPPNDQIKRYYYNHTNTGLLFSKRDVQEEDRRYIKVDAAKILCNEPKHLSVKIPPKDKERGWIPARLLRRLKIVFDVCGVIHIPNLFSKELIDRVRASQENHLAYLKRREVVETRLQQQSALKNRWGLKDNATNATVGLFAAIDLMRSSNESKEEALKLYHHATETADAGLRGDGRYEVKLPIETPFICPALTQNRIVYNLLKSYISHKMEIDEFSYITLERKSKEMHWHQDVDWIFGDEMFLDEKSHLPPHAVVMVLPLIDMADENGPTEFIAGTQHNVGGNRLYWWRRLHMWSQKYGLASHSSDTADELLYLPPRVHFTGQRGGVTLFDLRVFHRGRPNRSADPRTVLYISYVRDWFQDKVNFKEPHSKIYDDLPDDTFRKLMGRAEMRSYLRDLEKFTEKALEKLDQTAEPQKEFGEEAKSSGGEPLDDTYQKIAELESKLSEIRRAAIGVLDGKKPQTMLDAMGYKEDMIRRISPTEFQHRQNNLQK